MSDSVWPHRRQPSRLPCPCDSPGKNTGVGCHFLLQCVKVKCESEVAQSCPILSDPIDGSLPGSSIHGIFQSRVLEWDAIAFSDIEVELSSKLVPKYLEGRSLSFCMLWLVFAASINVARESGWLPEMWLKKIEGRVRPWPAGEWGSRCGISLVQVRHLSGQAADYNGLLWADISWDKVVIIRGSQSEKGIFPSIKGCLGHGLSELCSIEVGRGFDGGSSVLWIAPCWPSSKPKPEVRSFCFLKIVQTCWPSRVSETAWCNGDTTLHYRQTQVQLLITIFSLYSFIQIT